MILRLKTASSRHSSHTRTEGVFYQPKKLGVCQRKCMAMFQMAKPLHASAEQYDYLYIPAVSKVLFSLPFCTN